MRLQARGADRHCEKRPLGGKACHAPEPAPLPLRSRGVGPLLLPTADRPVTTGLKASCRENTLFYLLLILKAFKANPKVFNEAQALQQSFYRRREWSITIPDGGQRTALLAQIEALMAGMGATRIEHDGSGHSLGAVLYRRGVDTGTYGLERGWLQLFQRISESEDSLLRFEVIAENEAVGLPLVEALLALQGRFTQTT